MFLPVLAENRKLQYLNISGNTLVDSNADAYDLFPLEELNEEYLGTAPKNTGDNKLKAPGPKKAPGKEVE